MKHFSIGQRLVAAFGVLVCLSLGVGATALFQLDRLSRLTDSMYRHPLTVGNAVRDIRANTYAIHNALKEIVYADDPGVFKTASHDISATDSETMSLFSTVAAVFTGNPGDLENARLAFVEWKPIRDRVLVMKRLGQTEKAVALLRNEAADHLADIDAKTKVMIDFSHKKANSFLEHAHQTRREVMTVLALLVGLSVLVISLVGISVTRGITRPILELNAIAAQIAAGVTLSPKRIDREDEVGQLGASINRIIVANNKILTQAKAIAVGDYESDIALRSEADELGQALFQMTASLRKARTDAQLQEWFQNGETGLNDCMRGTNPLPTFAATPSPIWPNISMRRSAPSTWRRQTSTCSWWAAMPSPSGKPFPAGMRSARGWSGRQPWKTRPLS
jgi:methyl-accepting chemotaxis protein